MAAKVDAMAELQKQIAEKMMGIITNVMEQRSNYYDKHPNEIPTKADVSKIISKYSNRSMIASGVMGLAPGPLGLIAIIPEILTVIDSQVRAIYDIGIAHGRGERLTKELILTIFASAAVTGGIGILTVQGTKVLVQKTSASLVKRVLQIVAVKTSQGALRSSVAKFLPGVGAAAIAAWSNYSTRKVCGQAVEIFSREIEYVSNQSSDEISTPINEDFEVKKETFSSMEESLQASNHDNGATNFNNSKNQSFQQYDASIDELRIQALINLMLIDGKTHPEEQEYIRDIIEGIKLDYTRKVNLLESLDNSKKFKLITQK